MNTFNHAALGAIIGLTVHPVLAVPMAFASHFLLDAIPHFGYPEKEGYGGALKHRLTYAFLVFDAVGWLILAYLLYGQSLFVWFCAFLAVSPDIFWVYRYFWFERKGLKPPGDDITLWHRKIQWFERPIGFIVEILFAVFLLVILWRLV